MNDQIDTHDDEDKAKQIDTLHRNLSLFVNGAPLPILMGSLTMLITEIILDLSDDEGRSQRLADNFSSTLKLAIELAYLNSQQNDYVQ